MKRHSALRDFFGQAETAAARAQIEAEVRAIAREIDRIKKLKDALINDLTRGKLEAPEHYFEKKESIGTTDVSRVLRVLEMDVDPDLLANPSDHLPGRGKEASPPKRSASSHKSDVSGASLAIAQLCAASLVHGVSVVPGPTDSTGAPVPQATTYRFSPYVFGRPQGPFHLILQWGNPRKRRNDGSAGSEGAISVIKSDLPISIIPLLKQRKEETQRRSFRLGEEGEEEGDAQDLNGERAVIGRILSHLTAFLSRKIQTERLIATFPNDISNVTARANHTSISFCLRATENDRNDDENVLIQIHLRYDSDGQHPRPDSLRVGGGRTSEGVTHEDIEVIRGQCQVFYEKPLFDALRIAFLEN